MSRVEAVAAMDRLPWLPDEPKPQPVTHGRSGGALVLWTAALALLVAAPAYWFGASSVDEVPAPIAHRAVPTTTVRLPAPRPAVPAEPQVKLRPAPEIEPIVAPPMPVIDEPPPVKRAPEKIIATPRHVTETAPPPEEVVKPAPPPEPWPVRVIEGASGRLVRIGAFSTAHQAKRGWWAIVRMNPALKRLPALVVPVQSLRDGHVYYRLQMGTTSQAHSAVLCQRMRMIAQPCVVIGLAAAQ
ncbi:MAG: hypothetical protein ACJ8FT_02275 [Sphingomonas sp.]